MLVNWGMEVALDVEGRGNLAKMSVEDAQSLLADGQVRLKNWLADARISSLCLGDGSIPKDNTALASGGTGDQSYAFTATAGTVRGLAPSPRSSKFDPYRIPRVQATQAELERFLTLANQQAAYYASPGE